MNFKITSEMLAKLKAKDLRLGHVIDVVGPIEREVFEDVFVALVHAIVSQQISNAALQTVWKKLNTLTPITTQALAECSLKQLKECGLSERKCRWIKEMSQRIENQEINLEQLKSCSDEKIIETLMQFKGIGKWSAQMICIFAYQRIDILSLDDYGIRKGLCRLYEWDEFTLEKGRACQQRFSPYNTVASFYLWYLGNLSEWEEKKESFVL